MNKVQQIDYLNKIKPFINLKAVCDDYNQKTSNAIDYNNLRAVLNGVSKTRVSEDKLNSFIGYLYHYLYTEVFGVYDISLSGKKTKISNIISTYARKMDEEITKELRNEIRD